MANPPKLFLMLLVAYAKVEVRAITAFSLRFKKVKRSNDKESRVSHDEHNFVPPTKYGFYLVPKYITKSCNILQFFAEARADRLRLFFSYHLVEKLKLGC